MSFGKFVLIVSMLFGLAYCKDSIKELDINLENYDYPYPVKFYTFESQGQNMKMAYVRVRPKNFNNKSILLFHGKNFNIAYWGTTIDMLTKNGYEGIAVDQIGFGKSTKPEHYQYSFQQLAANTKKLLDGLEVKNTSVLGHSMGGMLATRFSLMYPKTVQSLILLNPIGLEDWKLKVPYVDIDTWYKKELKKSYEGIKAYQKASYYDGKWKAEYDEWVNILAGWTLNKEYAKIAWNAALTYDMIFTQPVVYEFKNIKVPTLLVIGTRDRTALGKNLVSDEVRSSMGRYEKLGKETAAEIPDATLKEIPNIGHLPHIEAFDEFKKSLLPFLKAL